MIYTPKTKKALKLCFEAHQDKTDRGGVPYPFHPYHLAEKMKDEDSICVALLHDVLEDTDCTAEQLASYGFGEVVVKAVVALTKRDDEDYFKYIARVGENEVAKKVKIADLLHNTDTTRLNTPPSDADFIRSEKYRKAIEMLVL